MHFGNTLNAGDAGDLFDFDADGIANVAEFAFGLDPKSGGSMQIPAFQRVGGNLTLTFSTPSGVEGVNYGAEWSTTLAPSGWTDISDTGITPLHHFELSAAAEDRVFVRLKVSISE